MTSETQLSEKNFDLYGAIRVVTADLIDLLKKFELVKNSKEPVALEAPATPEDALTLAFAAMNVREPKIQGVASALARLCRFATGLPSARRGFLLVDELHALEKLIDTFNSVVDRLAYVDERKQRLRELNPAEGMKSQVKLRARFTEPEAKLVARLEAVRAGVKLTLFGLEEGEPLSVLLQKSLSMMGELQDPIGGQGRPQSTLFREVAEDLHRGGWSYSRIATELHDGRGGNDEQREGRVRNLLRPKKNRVE